MLWIFKQLEIKSVITALSYYFLPFLNVTFGQFEIVFVIIAACPNWLNWKNYILCSLNCKTSNIFMLWLISKYWFQDSLLFANIWTFHWSFLFFLFLCRIPNIIKKKNLNCYISTYIHTYIIGHYNPLFRITTWLLTPLTYVLCINFYTWVVGPTV